MSRDGDERSFQPKRMAYGEALGEREYGMLEILKDMQSTQNH